MKLLTASKSVKRQFVRKTVRRNVQRSYFRTLGIEGLEKRELLTASTAPAIALNEGLEVTNLREVSVSFENVDAEAQSMRFAFNGFNYSPWQIFSPTTNVTIPSYYGKNYVNTEILFSDGRKRFAYDSIVYTKPTVEINAGLDRTNTRDVTLSFDDVAPDAVGVQFAFNGFKYSAPIAFDSDMTVTLPNYEGKNYVNAQIVYANSGKRFVWDSIEFQRTAVKIDNGTDFTYDRDVTLTFENVSSDAQEVSFAFNGLNYVSPVGFQPSMHVTLPNWDGVNYVNAKVHYADGREVWLWDSIEYVAPVQSCSQCVSFQFVTLDESNEGFRDPVLGNQRIVAFEHALSIWSSLLKSSYSGETIIVEAKMEVIKDENGQENTILGSAGPNDHSWIGRVAHGDALANHKQEQDIDAITAEISATFNTKFDWYYGTDKNPPTGKRDFVSTVLHEIGHGLNFSSLIKDDGTWNGGRGIYDEFLVDGQGTRLASMSITQRQAAIISDDVFWDGTEAKVANNGHRPKIYAPAEYKKGSSVSHLDEGLSTHGHELMSPEYSGPDHSVGAIELAMLQDMGWTLVG